MILLVAKKIRFDQITQLQMIAIPAYNNDRLLDQANVAKNVFKSEQGHNSGFHFTLL